jgi:diguanylate cyclase (GGDEF)-like protein
MAMIVSDQMMPGISGIDLIERLKVDHPDMVSILLTGRGAMDAAQYAINCHLLDQYVSKPIEDIQVFVSMMANLLKRHHLDLAERDRTEQLAKTVMKLRAANETMSAMRACAEEMVTFAKALKSMELDEVMAVASRELGRLFHAQDVRVYLTGGAPFAPPAEGAEAAASPANLPGSCTRGGQEGRGPAPELVIPLSMRNVIPGRRQSEEQSGYACIWGMDPAMAARTDELDYKVGLVSEILSASLTNARLHQQVKNDSETDFLTGACTRRALEEALELEYQRAVRYHRPFSLIIVDIDRFKTINDRAGHIVGDETLRHLAQILREEVRKIDTLARFGGDEFVALMPETDLDAAVRIAERMRKHTEASLGSDSEISTISCGVAGWCGDEGDTVVDVLRRADAALYRAKLDGRNTVRIERAA